MKVKSEPGAVATGSGNPNDVFVERGPGRYGSRF